MSRKEPGAAPPHRPVVPQSIPLTRLWEELPGATRGALAGKLAQLVARLMLPPGARPEVAHERD